jgi:hypothetical protein
MYTINRAPSIQIPGMDQFTPVRHDYSGIERGLSAAGKGLADYFEERDLERQLEEANNPQVEEIARRQAATEQQRQQAQAETDQVLQQEAIRFAYGEDTPTQRTPEQDAEVQSYLEMVNRAAPQPQPSQRGLDTSQPIQPQQVQWVDPNAQTTQTTYQVGDQSFYNRPDQQSLDIIAARNKAKLFEARDPRLAMAYMQQAQQMLAQQMEQRYLELENNRDVEGAVQMYSDIPDNQTAVAQRMADGLWQVYLHPDGRPEEARLFAQGTGDDVFSAIRRTMDPKAWETAANLKYTRDRQAETDQRYAQQEARYADNARRQELTTQLNYLRGLKEKATTEADYIRFGMMEEQAAAELFGMGQGGLGGPVQGPSDFDTSQYGTNGGASSQQIDRTMQYMPLIQQEASAAGVDPLLVAAVAAVESSGNAAARSPKNAQGLMQLIPATAQRFGVTNINDPQQNIRGGAQYLAWLTNRFDGNLEHALAGYNAGEGRVDQYGGIPPFAETQAYVPRVLATYNRLRQQYGGDAAATQQGLGGPVMQPGMAGDGMGPPEPTPQDRGIGALGTDFRQAWAAGQKPAKAPERFTYSNEGSQAVVEEATALAHALVTNNGETPAAWDQLGPAGQQKAIYDVINKRAAVQAPLTGKAFVPFTPYGPASQAGTIDYDAGSAAERQRRAAQQQ